MPHTLVTLALVTLGGKTAKYVSSEVVSPVSRVLGDRRWAAIQRSFADAATAGDDFAKRKATFTEQSVSVGYETLTFGMTQHKTRLVCSFGTYILEKQKRGKSIIAEDGFSFSYVIPLDLCFFVRRRERRDTKNRLSNRFHVCTLFTISVP